MNNTERSIDSLSKSINTTNNTILKIAEVMKSMEERITKLEQRNAKY